MKHALLVTEDPTLIKTFERLVAVSQATLKIDPMPNSEIIHNAFRIFIDDQCDAIDSGSIETVVLSTSVTRTTWELAAKTNAVHVASLPESEDWLLQHLVHTKELESKVIGFIPVVGGAGASYMAAATATFLGQTSDTVIIDADPSSGGIDLLFGAEQEIGTRWPQISDHSNSGFAEDLIRSLPSVAGVKILSGSGELAVSEIPLKAVVDSVRSYAPVVVIDFPRQTSQVLALAKELCDEVFLVGTTTVRSCAVLSQMTSVEHTQNCGLIIRQIPGSGLEATQVAASAGLGIRAIIPNDIKLVETVEQGLGFSAIRMTPFVKSVKSFTENLVSHIETARAA